MKKTLCILLGVMLAAGCACAEATIAPTAAIQLVTPTPSPEPAGEVFSSEDLIVTLPLGLEILDADTSAGYDAALQADYPDTARTILLAANADSSAALSFSVMQSDASAADAANEAAKAILGDGAAISENKWGENTFFSFSCSIGEQAYQLYFTSDGSRMLAIGASGISDTDIETMLTGLIL